MLKRLDHVEIVPQDFARSLAFYTDVLGFKVDHRTAVNASPLNEVVYLTLGGSAIELLRVDAPTPASRRIGEVGYNAMAWEVDDMDGTLHDLAAKDIAPTWGPRRTPSYIRAEIADPDGNSIELRQWLRKPKESPRTHILPFLLGVVPVLSVLAIRVIPERFEMERQARSLLAQHPGAQQTTVYLQLRSTSSNAKQREIDAKIAEMEPQGWTYLRGAEASPLRTIRSWRGGVMLHFIRTKSAESRPAEL